MSSLRPGLTVRVYGETVGTLHRDRDGGTHFTPDSDWLGRDQKPPLGLAFLVDPAARIVRGGVPTWFDNLLPEKGSALREWICRQRNIRENDSGSLLQVLGRDLPGAVDLVGDTTETVDEQYTPQTDEHIRFSLAGIQLKFSMLLSGERFVLPARGQTGRWIVKIPGEKFADLPDVEAATMAWARSAGLAVPNFHILPIEAVHGASRELVGSPPKAFAIERFDRTPQERVHQEDFAQAFEIPSIHKYCDAGPRRTSYDGMARLVFDVCGEESLLDFTARVAFVIASGNGDAHLKNWSLQWGREHRPWLSPCYDQVATVSWPTLDGWEVPGGPTLALAFGKVRKYAYLDRAALRRFIERSKSTPDAEDRFMAALERIRSVWSSIATMAPDRMRRAIKEHWKRVPILSELGGLPED